MTESERLMVSVLSSLTGFHDPKKHHGLRAQAFLELYQQRLRSSKKPIHAKYLECLRSDFNYFHTYVVQHLLNKKRVL